MKPKNLILLVVVFATPLSLFGQYAFKVLANKGGNEVKSAEGWQPIKMGSTLKDGDEIKLVDNSYVGLVSNLGKALEVKTPGIHTVAQLKEELQKGGSSVMQKYTDFILSSNSPEAKKNRLSATGAVHRGEVKPIHLLLPEPQNASLFNTTAIISWQNTKVAGPYVLTVMDMFNEVLEKIETPETSYTVNFASPKLSGQSALIIQVVSKDDSKEVSKEHLIKRLSPAEYDAINKSLQEIGPELSEQTALNKLILAGFYEDKRLLIDAITCYEEAIKLAPDVPTYQEAYEEFLLRNNIVK